jgi:4-hydroxy-tetrahydrodipicolinate reductase
MPITNVAIHGAAGRMGQRLIALAAADQQLRIVAALESDRHPKLGQDAGQLAGVGALGVPLSASFDGPVDAVIDFSVPAACERIVSRCVERRWPLVVATTGFDARQKELIMQAAESIPLLWSPSMSLTVNLAMKLSAIAAQALARQGGGVDVEIIERHHRFKEDAPSGTALKFGEIIAGVMGQTRQAHGRQGRPGERPRDEIGYHAVRVGDNPGEHAIVFGMLGETLEIAVKASSRDCYAHGALAAARFIAGQPPGLYGIENVLGL